MPPFEIRRAVAEDLGAIAAGFARSCGKPPEAVEPKVRWALGANPAGWSGVVAVDARGAIVAHLGVSHVPMSVGGESVVFGRHYASWVDESVRIAGVHAPFAEIDDAFREAFEGTAFAASYGLFQDSDWWTLRRLRDFAPVRTEITLERPPRPYRADGAGAALARVTAEALGGGAIPLGGAAARRDAATLLFRTGGPWSRDSAWLAVRDGRPAGVAIWRDEAGSRVVLDLSVPAGDEDAARALLDLVIGDGSCRVHLPFFTRSPWFLLAQRKGFRAAASDLPYLVVRPSRARSDASALMETWHFGAADVGLRALPAMLAVEEVVTAAPIGTVAARERHA
jgi:hypothetical protein